MISRSLIKTSVAFGMFFGVLTNYCISSPLPAGSDLSGSEKVTALKIVDATLGSGTPVTKGSKVLIHYTGWVFDERNANSHGQQIISSIEKGGTPFSFTVGDKSVIQGWDNGVLGMKVGGKRTIIIPSNQAYGKEAAGVVPANSALVFEVHLISAN